MNHHGEYKVPGGKLVVVDFDVEVGMLRRVRVSGDFFLFPDTAIHALNAHLEGAAVTASRSEFVRRAADGLIGAEILGCSPEDIAEAIARALE